MRSLTLKLTLAFLVVSLLGIALVAAIIWAITFIEFNRFLTSSGLNEYTATVTDYYNAHGSWDGVAAALAEEGLISTSFQPGSSSQTPLPSGSDFAGPPRPFVLVDPTGRVIVDSGPFHAGSQLNIENFQQNVAIQSNNQVVGYVLVTGGSPRLNPIAARYINQTRLAMVYAILGAGLIAVLLGLFLARTITRPIKELTAATGAMARGQLDQKVPVRSNDELGELTRTFNTMSADLEQARHTRQQMTADIAHDLRTPLSVITGYLEGMKDGILKPTPARFVAMYDEALYLQRLVEDLRTLSLADAGELSLNCQDISPAEVIERLASVFQHQVEQKEIILERSIETGLPLVHVDPERMQQVLGNLVSNALRYTPPGGKITLSTAREASCIQFEVKDTGAGISGQALEHIFDRFYRGDDSRQEGGSGLGLAIAKSIVELQGGAISAASAGPGAGSQFRIRFPSSEND